MTTAARQLKGRAARLARMLPSGPNTAARTPFVLLVVVLLGGGLITLLLLNSALNAGSFRLNDLKKKTTELTDEQQALQRDVDDRSAPDALEQRARELGMVPGDAPAFLNPDGSVKGVPGAASAVPQALVVPASPTPTPTPTPSATAPPSGSASPPLPSPTGTRPGSAAHPSAVTSTKPTQTPGR
ncbi:FtsB family cell division protein [Streptomyces sp. NBC_01465]|uniref:FtsB family cell division protein n=1 Tax=Streptomyces sp. NBC_01465 TaxID=2903878 RepID=UPI002E339A97|nr:septum formation initiator family protein [Streptomyces sp. NBC_01465]